MNEKKWNEYIQRLKVPKTNSGINITIRKSDIEFISKFADISNKKILDIGCEEGATLEHFKKRFNCEIYGATLGDTNKEYITKCDMHELDFDDDSFDIVFISHTLEHSISPYIVLHEIRRVLKKGGIVIIIMPEEGDIWTSVKQHYSTMTFRQLFNLLNKLSFRSKMNFRKEYMINMRENKRDILSIWTNHKGTIQTINDNISLIPVPIKCNIIFDEHNTKFTYIDVMVASDREICHFLNRTDSLT